MRASKICLINTIIIILQLQHFELSKANNFQGKFQPARGPCEDFYEYACGNYSQHNTDVNYSEIIQKLDYEMNKKLLAYLGSAFANRTNDVAEQTFYLKMGIYWQSCRDETERNLRKYFQEIRPAHNLQWPLLEPKRTWLEPKVNFDYWPLLGQMQAYGLNNVIVKQHIIRTADNTLNIWLAAPQPEEEGFNLPASNVLQVLLRGLGVHNSDLIIEQLTASDLKWRKMAQQQAKGNQLQTITFNEFALLYPRLNVKLYLQQLLGPEVNNLSMILVENPQYFHHLNHLQWRAEDLKHLCNYLMLKFLYHLAVDSTAEFTPLECVKDLRNKFDLAVNFYYYHRFSKQELHKYTKAVFNLIQDLGATMSKYFEGNYLQLSGQQVQELQTKLKKLKINIGNLPDKCNYDTVQDFYSEIPALEAGNYYRNHLLLLKQRFRNTLAYQQNQTHFIVQDNRMGGSSSAFYVPQQNTIVIPFGSLQLPLFHYRQSALKKLSLFGFVLAHELTHAFDTTSLQFDQQGFPLTTRSDILDQHNFSKSVNCMQHQQPTQALDERIADLFAVRVAYRCYVEKYAKGRLDLRKRFFWNLAQFFCGKSNLKFIDHDADAMRLQQIVQNFGPFAKVYGCSVGSPMHPKLKCRLY